MQGFVSKKMQDDSVNGITRVGVISAWLQVGETKNGNVFFQVRNLDYYAVVRRICLGGYAFKSVGFFYLFCQALMSKMHIRDWELSLHG